MHRTSWHTYGAVARGGIVTIAVGSECVKYEVHRAILMQHSGYFKKALEGPWKEAEEGVVRLEDVESETCRFPSNDLQTLIEPTSRHLCGKDLLAEDQSTR